MGNSCVCQERGTAVITDSSSSLYTKRETPHFPNSGSVNQAFQGKADTTGLKPVATVVGVQPPIATVQPTVVAEKQTLTSSQQTVTSGITVIPVNASDLPTPAKSVVVITDKDIILENKGIDQISPVEQSVGSLESAVAKVELIEPEVEDSTDYKPDTNSQDSSQEYEDSDDDMPVRKQETPSTMSQLKLTKPAPEFTGTAVVDGDFQSIALSKYKGKYVVFFFYPLDFTFVCPTEIIAFSDRVEEFRNINCEVIGCSTDSHFSHLAWINTPRKQGGLGEMKIPLLADKNCEIAKAYGVYKEDEGIAFRGLFIIDDKGNLRQITVNDLPVGRSVDETLRLVQAFQFTDKHGEVCPAGWKPGAQTMKPNPKESKSYFQKAN